MLLIRKLVFLKLLITWLAISSFLLILFYNYFNSSINLLALKDVFIYLLVSLSFFIFYDKYKINKKVLIYFMFLFIVLIYAFLISGAPLFAKAASTRQIITPFILMFLGYQFTRSPYDYRRLIRFIILLSFIIVGFGFFERFSHLWLILSLKEYFALKNIMLFPIGYPVMFIEPLSFNEFDGIKGLSRMVSTLLDPINLGHTLAAIITVVYYERFIFKGFFLRTLVLTISFIALLLTFSKGAYLELLFIFFIFNKDVNIILRLLSIVLIFVVGYYISLHHNGFIVHFLGFYNIFEYLSFFGNGLATFGNYAHMFATDTVEKTGVADSFWGSLIGQIGLIGFLIWYSIFHKIIENFPYNHYLTRILVAQFLFSALSENAFNLLSVFIPMFLIGSYFASIKYNKEFIQ